MSEVETYTKTSRNRRKLQKGNRKNRYSIGNQEGDPNCTMIVKQII